MNREVWKFPVPFHAAPHPYIEMPLSAEVLSVGVRGGEVYVWALVDPDDPARTNRRIAFWPTGGPVPENCAFIGTAFAEEGLYVWHVFEEEG